MSPSRTFSESTHHGLPWPACRLRASTSAWCPCRCIGCTSPLSFTTRITTTSPDCDHEHGHVRPQLAVDGPPEAGTAVVEARTAGDDVLEASVRRLRVDPRRRWRSVAQEVHEGVRCGLRSRVDGVVPQNDRVPAQLDPAPPAGTTTSRSTRPPAVTTTAWSRTVLGRCPSVPWTATTR